MIVRFIHSFIFSEGISSHGCFFNISLITVIVTLHTELVFVQNVFTPFLQKKKYRYNITTQQFGNKHVIRVVLTFLKIYVSCITALNFQKIKYSNKKTQNDTFPRVCVNIGEHTIKTVVPQTYAV